jgi:hypothetical protein
MKKSMQTAERKDSKALQRKQSFFWAKTYDKKMLVFFQGSRKHLQDSSCFSLEFMIFFF